MKRPRRAFVVQGDEKYHWSENHSTAPGDAWVCADGGWHSRPTQMCSEDCTCVIDARQILAEMNKEERNVP